MEKSSADIFAFSSPLNNDDDDENNVRFFKITAMYDISLFTIYRAKIKVTFL
jgi:hypothetical protein